MRLDRRYADSQRRTITAGIARRKQAIKQVTAVCLVGPEGPVPRFNGDNRGGMPVRVVINGDRKLDASKAVRAYANTQFYHRAIVLEHILVPSRQEATKLKSALDICLRGEQRDLGNDAMPPINQWRDVMGCWDDPDTRAVWWGLMLDAAQRDVTRSHGQRKPKSRPRRRRR